MTFTIQQMIEIFANIAHDVWSNWMKYLFTKGTLMEDGTFSINADSVKRWQRQINTPYNELSEEEKKSDKEIAMKYLNQIFKF